MLLKIKAKSVSIIPAHIHIPVHKRTLRGRLEVDIIEPRLKTRSQKRFATDRLMPI